MHRDLELKETWLVVQQHVGSYCLEHDSALSRGLRLENWRVRMLHRHWIQLVLGQGGYLEMRQIRLGKVERIQNAQELGEMRHQSSSGWLEAECFGLDSGFVQQDPLTATICLLRDWDVQILSGPEWHWEGQTADHQLCFRPLRSEQDQDPGLAVVRVDHLLLLLRPKLCQTLLKEMPGIVHRLDFASNSPTEPECLQHKEKHAKTWEMMWRFA